MHKSQPFELVFSCRCGKQLFGDTIQIEYDRQKAEWEARPPEEVPKTVDDATLRKQEDARRREQLRKAMEYRRTYLADKRKVQADAEKAHKDKEDKRWRERVAKVESEHGADTTYLQEGVKSRKSKPTYTTRTVAKPAIASKLPPPRKAAAKPKAVAKPAPAPKVAVPVPTPLALSPNRTIEYDDDHPHAEFMAYLAEGSFFEFFPNCTPPDVKDATLCVWPPCEKPRRKKSKYCSRECSNKNARWRHKMRKRRS